MNDERIKIMIDRAAAYDAANSAKFAARKAAEAAYEYTCNNAHIAERNARIAERTAIRLSEATFSFAIRVADAAFDTALAALEPKP